MVTIGSVLATSGDKSLGNAEDSDDEYPGIMMREEAGNLVCSLTGMFKIHLYESGIKVHFPRPLLYKQRFSRRLYCSKFPGALF